MRLRSFHQALPPESLEEDATTVAYFRGAFVPLREAKVSILTHAFLFGTAVFEGIRGYCDPESREVYLFRLRDHYERMRRSGHILKIKLPHAPEELSRLTCELVRRNGYREDCYVRAVAYKSGLQIGLRLDDLDDFTMFALPQGRFFGDNPAVSACVTSWRRVEDNAVPARGKIQGAYVNSALAMTEALDNGFNDAILLTEDGHVSEGSGMNLFLVRGGRLYTPPRSENILEGITRETVFELARRELGVEVVERRIDRSELYTADELFFCGTGVEIVPISSVDRRPVGEGSAYPVARKLAAVYREAASGRRADYREYITPVYEDAGEGAERAGAQD
ncbi:MAG TPA: branched-chain amino acid transaminase [Pyrinomonadaceae bacterium]|jgi:branched-chain amino acid aminotransferase